MTELNRRMVETLARQVVTERLMLAKQMDPSGIISIKLPEIDITENDRLDTDDPADIVYTKGLFSLEESPHPGCSLMVVKDTTLDWTLEYDEVDYTISGQLDVLIGRRKTSATASEIILIPENGKVQFSVAGDTRFVYMAYLADWRSQ